jgi:hypothetical protein
MVLWTFSAVDRFGGLTSPFGARFVLTFDPCFPAWWWEDIELCPGQVLYPITLWVWFINDHGSGPMKVPVALATAW